MRTPDSVLGMGAILLFVGACSLLYDLNADQCQTTGDCREKGAAFDRTECRQGICVLEEEAVTECTVNEDCSRDIEGSWSICRRSECLRLTSGDSAACFNVIGANDDGQNYLNFSSPPPLVVGGYADIATSNLYGNVAVPNYELALLEYNRKATRKVVMVICNGNTDDLGPSLEHLVGTVEVPAIVAGIYNADLSQLLDRLKSYDRQVFVMNPLEADRSIESADREELVWHIVGTSEGLAPIYQPLLDRIGIASLNERRDTVVADDALRVAIVEARPLLSTLSAAVRSSVKVGGLTLDRLISDDAALLSIVTGTNGARAPEHASTVSSILDFAPHVIISMAGFEFVQLLQGIEDGWAASAPPGQPRPYYVVSPMQYNDPQLTDLASNPIHSFRDRLLGVNHSPGGNEAEALYLSYLNTLESDYGVRADQLDLAGTENFYDAMWYTLYATAAAGDVNSPTGAAVSDGMKRLVEGTATYDILHVSDVLSAIAPPSARIRLTGTMGIPDFDSYGVRETVPSVYCLAQGAAGRAEFASNAYGFDFDTQALIEYEVCNPDF